MSPPRTGIGTPGGSAACSVKDVLCRVQRLDLRGARLPAGCKILGVVVALLVEVDAVLVEAPELVHGVDEVRLGSGLVLFCSAELLRLGDDGLLQCRDGVVGVRYLSLIGRLSFRF